MTGKQPQDTEGVQLGYVYLIHNPKTGWFKIGSARRPHVRLKQLCSEMRSECIMLHTIATNHALRLERECQERFLESHQGGEWFDLTGVDIELICAVSTVFYRDAEWVPSGMPRSEFDKGAKWVTGLPVCGVT